MGKVVHGIRPIFIQERNKWCINISLIRSYREIRYGDYWEDDELWWHRLEVTYINGESEFIEILDQDYEKYFRCKGE